MHPVITRTVRACQIYVLWYESCLAAPRSTTPVPTANHPVAHDPHGELVAERSRSVVPTRQSWTKLQHCRCKCVTRLPYSACSAHSQGIGGVGRTLTYEGVLGRSGGWTCCRTSTGSCADGSLLDATGMHCLHCDRGAVTRGCPDGAVPGENAG